MTTALDREHSLIRLPQRRTRPRRPAGRMGLESSNHETHTRLSYLIRRWDEHDETVTFGGVRRDGCRQASREPRIEAVRLLCQGSELVFEDAGEHELKGLPGPWRLFRLVG